MPQADEQLFFGRLFVDAADRIAVDRLCDPGAVGSCLAMEENGLRRLLQDLDELVGDIARGERSLFKYYVGLSADVIMLGIVGPVARIHGFDGALDAAAEMGVSVPVMICVFIPDRA